MKAGWEFKKLEDLIEVQNGYAFKSNEYSEDGHFVMRIGNVQNGLISLADPKFVNLQPDSSLSRFELFENDILVSLTGNVGRVGVIENKHLPAVLNQRVARIRPIWKAKANREFLLYFLTSHLFREELSGAGHGAAQQNVSTKDLLKISIPIPPLSEQAHIVGILDEAFASIATAKANTQKNLGNAKAVFESHLNSVFSNRGEGWIEKKLGEVCDEITVGHVGSMADQYKESGIHFLRSQNIRPFEVSLENVVFIDQSFHNSLRKSQLRCGDLAIVRTGYPGTAAVIPDHLKDVNCSDLVIVRPSNSLNPYYLEGFFNSPYGKELVLGKLVGAAQKHFNVTAAKDVRICIPPQSVQLDVVRQIGKVREETTRLTSLYTQKLSALEDLKKSLLHQTFTGKL